MKFQSIVPTICATSLKKAKDFYTLIGFTVDWIWPDENPTHLSLSKDGVSFMVSLQEYAADIQTADLYFRVEGVEEVYMAMKESLKEVPELIQTEYGMLDFSITDPWGHNLTFGEPHGDWEG